MAEQAASLNSVAGKIVSRADVLYEFIIKYSALMLIPHDYGTGEPLNMIEAHLITFVEEHPGITGSEVAGMWMRTKGAISQQIKKLAARGYIEKRKEGGNAKTVHLYATKKGVEFSLAHKMYDISDITQTVQQLLKSCTAEEILAFYKVTGAYCKLLDE